MAENFSGVKLPQGRLILLGALCGFHLHNQFIIDVLGIQIYIVSREQYWSAYKMPLLLVWLSMSAQMPSWSFSSMTGAKIVAWNLLVDGWCCCWSWGRLWAISQGSPPPIKGMARAPVNQPTTNNNTETSKHAQNLNSTFIQVKDIYSLRPTLNLKFPILINVTELNLT